MMDWTDGCIAVTDQEMDEIWLLFRRERRLRFDPEKLATLSQNQIEAVGIRTSSRFSVLSSQFSSIELGGPGRDRTDDLFHAMEARSQLRHRPTRKKNQG